MAEFSFVCELSLQRCAIHSFKVKKDGYYNNILGKKIPPASKHRIMSLLSALILHVNIMSTSQNAV